MKRRTYAHSRRKTNRPAVLKQQILRREARKRAKYPMRTVYHYPAFIRSIRGACIWLLQPIARRSL